MGSETDTKARCLDGNSLSCFYGRDSYEGEQRRRHKANGLRELMAHGLWDPKIGLLKKNPTSLNSPEMDVFRLSSMPWPHFSFSLRRIFGT